MARYLDNKVYKNTGYLHRRSDHVNLADFNNVTAKQVLVTTVLRTWRLVLLGF